MCVKRLIGEKMKLPKPQKSIFKYEMSLLMDSWDSTLWKNLPDGIYQKLDYDERLSIIAYVVLNNL